MENDIYRQVIQELSKKSEKDYGFRRVEGEKSKITRYIGKSFFILVQLTIVTVLSIFFAEKFNEYLYLSINLYAVAVSVAILGVVNYPFLWRKITRRYIVVIILFISVLLALRIVNPANVIPQINDKLPLTISWGILVTLISLIIYFFSHNIVTLAELLLDLASIFLPVLPTTFGNSLPDLTLETYKILYRETIDKEMGENGLRYLVTASQADIDSAGVRSLPWVVLLGFGATNFSGIFTGTTPFFSINSFLGFPLLIIGILAIFNIARMTYFQTLIIQVSNRLLLEISIRDNEKKEEFNNYVFLTENNRLGCLLKILFPWKKSS